MRYLDALANATEMSINKITEAWPSLIPVLRKKTKPSSPKYELLLTGIAIASRLPDQYWAQLCWVQCKSTVICSACPKLLLLLYILVIEIISSIQYSDRYTGMRGTLWARQMRLKYCIIS